MKFCISNQYYSIKNVCFTNKSLYKTLYITYNHRHNISTSESNHIYTPKNIIFSINQPIYEVFTKFLRWFTKFHHETSHPLHHIHGLRSFYQLFTMKSYFSSRLRNFYQIFTKFLRSFYEEITASYSTKNSLKTT